MTISCFFFFFFFLCSFFLFLLLLFWSFLFFHFLWGTIISFLRDDHSLRLWMGDQVSLCWTTCFFDNFCFCFFSPSRGIRRMDHLTHLHFFSKFEFFKNIIGGGLYALFINSGFGSPKNLVADFFFFCFSSKSRPKNPFKLVKIYHLLLPIFNKMKSFLWL